MMGLLLLAAGHETTANLIGNAVITLHDHRLAARSLRRHPDQIPAAVEELLRHESPVQLTSRVARRDTDLGGIAVPKGGLGLLSLTAPNPRPAACPHPAHLDI